MDWPPNHQGTVLPSSYIISMWTPPVSDVPHQLKAVVRSLPPLNPQLDILALPLLVSLYKMGVVQLFIAIGEIGGGRDDRLFFNQLYLYAP